jgi:Xaa-Pro aminopeptidase
MIDEEIRDCIQRVLSSTGFTVSGFGDEVEAVRQVKTEVEIGILRAVNTGTVEPIRAMRPCLFPDVTENEVREVLDDTLRAADFEPFFDIVELGKSAALPHGGYDGTRKLEAGMLILIDVGARLYGYSSDVTRTFYPLFHTRLRHENKEQVTVWQVVKDAQAATVKVMVPTNTAAAVDIAARKVIKEGGYGEFFTHHLGHGIDIKAHESPYLNQGNFGAVLRQGWSSPPSLVFTSSITLEFAWKMCYS